MSEGLSRDRGINLTVSSSGFMPRKPLTGRSAPTLMAAGVGCFLTRPGCPTASAGCGAAPHGLLPADSVEKLLRLPFQWFLMGTETLPQATIVDPRAILRVGNFSIAPTRLQTDFFNRIGHNLTVTYPQLQPFRGPVLSESCRMTYYGCSTFSLIETAGQIG